MNDSIHKMSDEALFFRQAAEAIVATSLNAANVDPTIRELLSRIKYANPNLPQAQAPVGQGVSASNGVVDPGQVTDEYNVLKFFTNPSNLSVAETGSSQTPAGEGSTASVRNKRKLGSEGLQNETRADGEKSSSDEKKYSCSKCKLEFRRTSDLRRHERTHLPVLPNICSQCGKGFARKDALKRHANTLTCRRNRSKLLSIGGDINEILERAQQTGNGT